MVVPVRITDPSDPRVDEFRDLKDVARRVAGTFVAESELVIRRLFASAYGIRSLLLAPNRVGRLGDLLESTSAPVFVAEQAILERIVGFALHRGGLAIGERLPLPTLDAIVADAQTVVVLDDVVDPDNIGAIFRHAAAFGVGAVVLSASTGDPLYRKSVRTSMGHVFAMPYARVSSSESLIAVLRRNGFTTLAFTPSATATDVRCVDPSPIDRLAILVGSESVGLSAAVLDQADLRVRIPIASGVDSLNVATSTAIALFALSSK